MGDEEQLVKDRIQEIYGNNLNDLCVGGTLNTLEWPVFGLMLYKESLVIASLTTVVILRWQIAIKLRSAEHISQNMRRTHEQLLQVSE